MDMLIPMTSNTADMIVMLSMLGAVSVTHDEKTKIFIIEIVPSVNDDDNKWEIIESMHGGYKLTPNIIRNDYESGTTIIEYEIES